MYIPMLTLLTTATISAGANQSTDSMDITSMMDIMLIILFIGCGFYSLYSFFLQKKERSILVNKIICPGSCEPAKCRAPEQFLRFILPRVLILGIGLILLGGLFLWDHFGGNNSAWLTIVLMILPLALFIWYVHEQRKAAKRFW